MHIATLAIDLSLVILICKISDILICIYICILIGDITDTISVLKW